MPAESLSQPISTDAIRKARARLALLGQTVQAWSTENGFDARIVYDVLSGRRKAIRGASFQIAVALGLRPDPHAAAPANISTPAGRTVAGAPPIAQGNRGGFLPVGEPVR